VKRSSPASSGAGNPAGKPAFSWLLALAVLLAAATLAAYSGVANCGFVNFDDPLYVTDNPNVRSGLTLPGIAWAFTSTEDANWFPLTRLSHLVDGQLFGLDPAGHHWTSVLIHALTTILLFLVLERLTGARYRSAFVAALFALHPLHVESVAWISERKDVLSAMFWMLTMLAYLRYVEQPRLLRYGLLVLSFALGLMAKPMVVTLPFVLLLLDFWPLRRAKVVDRPGLRKLVLEKLPLFVLAAAGSVVTFLVQSAGGATRAVPAPLLLRIQNAIESYVLYLVQMLWPARLAILYPFPMEIPVWRTLGGAALLIAITILVLKVARRFPYLPIGWLWYLGTLVPVIGFIQVGFQARADRYTYLPLIGIGIMLAWGLADLFRRSPVVFASAAGIALFACLLITRAQVETWTDGVTLFGHAVAVTSDNYIARNNLCYALAAQGQLAEAAPHCQQAIRIKPDYAAPHTNLGDIYLLQGRLDDSITESREALRLNPSDLIALANWANVLARQGKFDESAGKYREVLRVSPSHAVALIGLARVLTQLDRREDALALLQETVRSHPGYAAAHAQLGILLGSLGRHQEALDALTESIRLNPNDAPAHYNLGVTLSGKGRFGEAVGEFQRSLALNPRDPDACVELGNAFASLGRFDEAVANFQKALDLNPNHRRAQVSLEQATRLQQQSRIR
jgi:tetratricopeptide (TPR) repeat protein